MIFEIVIAYIILSYIGTFIIMKVTKEGDLHMFVFSPIVIIGIGLFGLKILGEFIEVKFNNYIKR